MSTRAIIGVETTRKEIFLLVSRALAVGHAGIPTDRFADLVRRLAMTDDAWLARLTGWMARHGTLRRLRLAVVAELVHARLEAGTTGARKTVDRALLRADEPGELLAYWIRRYGRASPKPIKRGVADATVRLYDELALAVYDSPGAAMRFADVLGLTHPAPVGDKQAMVFGHAVDRRRNLVEGVPEGLPLLRARRTLYWIPAHRRATLLERPEAAERLALTTMSWRTIQRWLLGEMTGPAWVAVLPSMSYQDRLAHLADFDRTGVSDEVARGVAAEFVEPASVIRSGVTPLEIYAAIRSVPASRWSRALRQAIDLSMTNVPALPGRTLVLIDRSDLMAGPAVPSLTHADVAAVFGAALALRASSADLVEFGTVTARVPVRPGRSLPETIEGFHPIGGAASPAHAVCDHLKGHDRVVILTHPDSAVETAEAVTTPGHEHIITDVSSGWFAAIPHIEMARTATWPF
ncbi:RNA-binding protein [Acrocarpospora pleiomorpha]|uniref:RNA-binding protein n=1 Tax=Acrocarpospora pleiomorpha TaxID=90975 RepID=A0A5M3XGS2_9ACTN|nr:TROVE domain-containing protein [Acrocarpospora pleiomorpha]GES20474.1 RNA-binding protein [Acrocarpospora pleiomorpha]